MTVTRPVISDIPPSHQRWSSPHEAPEIAPEIPSSWLDRLLLVASSTPVDDGPEAVARALLSCVVEVLPEHAVGLCLVGGAQGRSLLLCGDRAARASQGPPDPTRIFPALGHERVIALDAPDGSTLHIAHDEAEATSEFGPEGRFAERAARVLSGALRQAIALVRAREQSEQLRQLQAQVIQSEKLASLGEIAAGVVHELNNPLTSIVAYSDYLRKKAERGGQPDPEDIERLRRIGEAAERIRRFSRDLVDYSRPSAGVAASLSLHDVVEQSLVFCEHVLARAGVEVERDYDPSPSPMRGVAAELTQVFVNLVTNACHAMPDEGGRLIVRSRFSAELVEVDLIDNGHGIDPAHLGRIFEPFFTTKLEGRGTGLGLSIVRNIVARHGGSIHAESESGRGASFLVRLPLAGPPGG